MSLTLEHNLKPAEQQEEKTYSTQFSANLQAVEPYQQYKDQLTQLT